MSENRLLRRIFGPKREDVVGGWRRMHMWSFIAGKHHQILLE
jgi:hypothetical protein